MALFGATKLSHFRTTIAGSTKARSEKLASPHLPLFREL
jgi:8-oxo-dGTP diphosphatase